MKIHSNIKYSFLLMTIFSQISFANLTTEFDEYQSQVKNEFTSYAKQLDEEFKSYQNIVNEELNHEKKRLEKKWPDQYLGNKDEYVWYSKDLNQRAIINYKHEAIRIETADKKITQKDIKKTLKKISSLTQKSAFIDNPILNNIEKRTKKEIPNAKTSSLDDKERIFKPLLSNITDQSQQDKPELDNATVEKNKQGNAILITKKSSKGKISKLNKEMPKKAVKFTQYVEQYAKKYNVPQPLVFAIMESESSFNPMAKSHIPAYGLMQIVPRSAGRDASKLVLGKSKLLSPSYLYNKEKNIEMGAAYLHILFFRYLSKIENEESRLYCTIAAYNTGAGNVARAFTNKTNINKAAKTINNLTPQQVYDTLLRRLPYAETQKYLPKVKGRMAKYNV